MLKHHEHRQARALDRGQLGLGQGLQRMVVAGLAEAAAIGAIVVAADGRDPGALQLRQMRRDIEVGVDDLGAIGGGAEPLACLRKARRGRERANSRRAQQPQHVPA